MCSSLQVIPATGELLLNTEMKGLKVVETRILRALLPLKVCKHDTRCYAIRICNVSALPYLAKRHLPVISNFFLELKKRTCCAYINEIQFHKSGPKHWMVTPGKSLGENMQKSNIIL